MAVLSFTVLPPPPSFSLTPRACPPLAILSRARRRPLLFKHRLSISRPRASLGDNNDRNDEEPFQLNERRGDDSAEGFPSEQSVSHSATTGVNDVAALPVEREAQQEQLRETLATLSECLAMLSSTLNEVSSAVRVLSATLSSQSGPSPSLSPSELRDRRESMAIREGGPLYLQAPESWDESASPNAFDRSQIGEDSADGEASRGAEDTVPIYLVEQNTRAHKLAYKLQQSFIQARIEGLGKPFQVAAEDFCDACMEAHALGIGLKELQLQMVLQDGSLTGAFAIRNQRWSNDPILSEESRIRSLWIRLVYSTLAQLEPTPDEEKKQEEDPIDTFVNQVLKLALEEGYVLERIKLEQAFADPKIVSGAVKALRENQYLILLTLEKAKSRKQ